MKKTNHTGKPQPAETVPFAGRELKGSPAAFLFDSSFSVVRGDGQSQRIDSECGDKAATFLQNLKYWNKETGLMSTNNFNNSYFKEIVSMGTDAVPFIVKELEKEPSPLVHALDIIFPDVVEYDGYVSLQEACDTWLSILK